MATHTHPQLYPRDPQPQRPHTHPHSSPPGLLSRDAPSPTSRHLRLPVQDHHHHQQPNSWHASPYPQPLPSLGEKSHRSLPTEIRTLPPQKGETSVASLENARYSTDGTPRSEHTNEDRHFEVEVGAYRVFGVFDGHDGPRAAGFASNYFIQYFSSDSWNALTSLPPHIQRQQIPLALKEFFKAAEKDFFDSIRSYIEERKQLQRTIPRDMTSYQAYLTYPVEVARMQELEPKISGGTTVVLAVVCGDTLYIANTGDSRAVLVNENEKGVQQIVQLSEDHGVENIDELRRLVELGLDREQLQRSGRLGSHENTRSIGDYSIKEGYKDVDTLQQCRKEPGLCEPHVEAVPLTPHCKYVMLMTDGVYNSIEATFQEKASIDSSKVLMSMVNRERDRLGAQKRKFGTLSDRVVDRIRAIHVDAYGNNAAVDIRSPIAVACRKRDDMTLLIHQFEHQSSFA